MHGKYKNQENKDKFRMALLAWGQKNIMKDTTG